MRQLQPSPIRTAASPIQMMTSRVRVRDVASSTAAALASAARGGDDLVGLRQHALGVVIDEGDQRRDVFGARDPLGEGGAVGLDLLVELFLHRRRAVDRIRTER